MKKITFFLLGILCFQVHAEDLTLYSPCSRLGFGTSPSLVTLSFSNVQEGPSDKNFSLSTPLPAIKKGHMEFNEDTQYSIDNIKLIKIENEKTKNEISCFATARLTYETSLNILNRYSDYSLNNLNITLFPHDTSCKDDDCIDAYYQPTHSRIGGIGEIHFYSPKMPMSQYFDVVSHETGHAILGTLRPDFLRYPENHPYAGIFHESFADLTAFFTSIKLASFVKDEGSISKFINNLPNTCLEACGAMPHQCLRKISSGSPLTGEVHQDSIQFTSFYLTTIKDSYQMGKRGALDVVDYFHELLIKSVQDITYLDSFESIKNHIFNLDEQMNTYNPVIEDNTLEDGLFRRLTLENYRDHTF